VRPIIDIQAVRFAYRDRQVLCDVDLRIEAGCHLCLLGVNGAGKSTLLRLCAGLLLPRAGRVLLDGQELTKMTRARIARRVAYLPQESVHTFAFSALEVVLMGRYARATGAFEGPEDLAAARRAMEQTDCLHLSDRPIAELSGGERRRVALAQALAQETEMLLLDEPTAGLDPAHALALGRSLCAIAESGRALVWSTHDLNLAARFCPSAALLSQGRLVLHGPTRQVLLGAGPLLGAPLHIGELPSGAPFAVPA
jgi:iron complex transport system ATP-binding protein